MPRNSHICKVTLPIKTGKNHPTANCSITIEQEEPIMQMIYAHRGASGYAPENTLRAFNLAADLHAHGVELDVQLTRDGQVVVIHDETIDRVTGLHGVVADMTYEELLQYPIINATGANGEDRIPLLRDVLALLKKRGLKLNIELKNSNNLYPGMEEQCIRLVEEAGMTEDTMYSSFNHNSLLIVKQLLPQAKCGILYDCRMAAPWAYARANGLDALHTEFHELLLTEDFTRLAHESGVEVNPWTVNRKEDLQAVIAAGADRIITNYPDVALSLMK